MIAVLAVRLTLRWLALLSIRGHFQQMCWQVRDPKADPKVVHSVDDQAIRQEIAGVAAQHRWNTQDYHNIFAILPVLSRIWLVGFMTGSMSVPMACRKDLRSSIYLIYVPKFKDNHGVTSHSLPIMIVLLMMPFMLSHLCLWRLSLLPMPIAGVMQITWM